MRTAESANGIRIRLTDERWVHIVESHNELAGLVFSVLDTVANPDFIVRGTRGEKLAVHKLNRKYLVVVYKEREEDGFIITAFLTSKIKQIRKRGVIWNREF